MKPRDETYLSSRGIGGLRLLLYFPSNPLPPSFAKNLYDELEVYKVLLLTDALLATGLRRASRESPRYLSQHLSGKASTIHALTSLPFYSPIEESFIRPRATSDAFRGVQTQIPNTPLAHLFPEYRYEHPDPPRSPTPIDFFHPPGPPSPPPKDFFGQRDLKPSHPIWIFDSSLREVDFDVTCLGALDEQLLYAPKECFLDICWAEAVYDDDQLPVLQPQPEEKPWMWQPQTERETDSEESDQRGPDPIIMQVERKVSFFPSPESYTPRSPQRMMFAESESRMLYQNANHSVHFFPVPQQRKQTTQDPPDTPSGKLKLFSDAYGTLTGRRRTTSN
ncbi:hypothetical protein DFJ58DRAFT_864277 [Suillus subalutaceus]|uniref:uncharacterized protein n=1 Tax=Suillus subalutaceus TaxID=48586 RepID=UPI001B881A6C|nr:uncharacterized protein DFJ58DRAFT_864277 [Suillus subalutaceus]KAG1836794.1 hypothetical protein DFJ58DRAFT_864277 [Suillus subalutaceus]